MEVLMEQVASGIKNQLPECILGFFKDTWYVKTNTILSSLIYSKSMLNKCIWGAQEVDINLASLNQSGLLHFKHQVFSLSCKKTANLPYIPIYAEWTKQTEDNKWGNIRKLEINMKRKERNGAERAKKRKAILHTTQQKESQNRRDNYHPAGKHTVAERKTHQHYTTASFSLKTVEWSFLWPWWNTTQRNFWHSKVTFKALSKTTSLIQDREGRERLFFTGGIDPPWGFITVSVCKFTIANKTQHLLWLYKTHGTFFFVHILVRYHFRLIEFESFHPPGEKHGTQMTNNLPSLPRCW